MIDSLLIILPGIIWGASFLFIAEGLDAGALPVVWRAIGVAVILTAPLRANAPAAPSGS